MLSRGQHYRTRQTMVKPLMMVGTYTDIAERKQTEAALQRRNRELAFLNGILQDLTSTLDLDEVLTQVLEELRRVLDVTASSVWLIDAVYAGIGLPSGHGAAQLSRAPAACTVWRRPGGLGCAT